MKEGRANDLRVLYPSGVEISTVLRTAPTRTIASGMKAQIVTDRRNLANPGLRSALRQQRDSGARVRVAEPVPHYLTLIDGSVAVVASWSGSGHERTTVLREQTTVLGMRTLFDLVWRSAVPLTGFFGNSLHHQDDSFSPLACEIIGLLSEGLSDEEAARELRMSLRTFRRHVATIKEAVHARNRFQTAVRLTERGLL